MAGLVSAWIDAEGHRSWLARWRTGEARGAPRRRDGIPVGACTWGPRDRTAGGRVHDTALGRCAAPMARGRTAAMPEKRWDWTRVEAIAALLPRAKVMDAILGRSTLSGERVRSLRPVAPRRS